MVSTYEYITVVNLEAIDTDYSVIDSRYDNDFIEAIITMAERAVNEICGQSFSGTIPDGVVDATLLISKRLMSNVMIEDGYGIENATINENIIDGTVKELLAGHTEAQDWYVKVGDYDIEI